MEILQMKWLIYLCGLHSLCFAIFHIAFWRLFNWKTDLTKLKFVNIGIMQVLNIQMVHYFLFVAIICFLFPTELLTTNIGNAFLIGASIFWLIRTIQQFIFFRTNHYIVHILTSAFLIGAALFILPVVMNNKVITNKSTMASNTEKSTSLTYNEFKSNPKELTCKLTTPELQKRKETVLMSLKSKIIQKKELENGYAFMFPGTDTVLDELHEFVKTERKCCDFFTFNISISGDTSKAWLELTGDYEAKQFIENEIIE